jgi:flap endonuclease-1
MGVNISDLLVKKEIDISSLRDKIVAVDAHLFLYQFLTTIRQQDGSLLMDSQGRVTSHLSGLFSRNARLIQHGVRLAYVFDGKAPLLKSWEQERRKKLKEKAGIKFEEAKANEDIDEMKKYAARTTRLTSEMIQESKELIEAMGIPVIQAPSEGEAQAAYLVKQDKAYTVASQDADSLLFGSPRLLRNLSLAGRRKKTNKLAYETIEPEIVNLKETLDSLDINQDQLIVLGILVGTDFNDGGIKGIGVHKGLKIVKEHQNDFDTIFKELQWDFDYSWKEVFDIFKRMPVTDDYSLKWKPLDRNKVYEILVEEHEFSEERVNSTLEKIDEEKEKQTQKGLGEFFN